MNAIQEGAQSYISKSDITPEGLQRAVRIGMEHSAMQKRIHEQRVSLEIFTRALAHDLKEPARTIRSFVELIGRDAAFPERAQSYFDYIKSASERMIMLIDTIYLYTRLDGGQEHAFFEACDGNGLLRDTKENLAELIREHQAVITSDPLPEVLGNRMQLMQVLQNLLANAIRHCEKVPVIHVDAEEQKDHWLLRIRDNGPGISSEQRERVFEPFKRLKNNQGLGLGLAICRKIIEAHGGEIWCETPSGAGTAFLFTLPKTVSARSSAPIHPEISGAVSQDRLGTILLVEDNEADIELTRIMLIEEARLQCNLLVARDGQEALTRLRSEMKNHIFIDLVLLDINMPRMDGFELLRQMRAEEALQHVPVVMCTTSTYDRDMEMAKSLGADGYLTKPADLGKLRAAIDGAAAVRLCAEGEGYALRPAA
ncbi:MAG: response regulator [Alphaproteobacteria bacterium]|nr:response regulator [Alphaproteobacteria bacterium]